MKAITNSSVFVAALGALLACHAMAAETVTEKPKSLAAGATTVTSVTAKVQAVDPNTREVTLKDQQGELVTFVVDERVKRLNEVKVGDQVTADYYVSWTGELRAPTEEEKKNPLTIIEDAARAPEGTSPAGGALRAFKVVATVVAIDLPNQSVTLEGPRGNTGSIRAEKPENLKKVKVGDTVIVTYVEALAVSLQKVPPGTK